MLTSVLVMVARLTFGKQLLGLVAAGNSALSGNRSEIIASIAIAVSALEHFGIIPAKTADPIIAALLGAIPVTMAEKISNVLDDANKVLPPPPAA